MVWYVGHITPCIIAMAVLYIPVVLAIRSQVKRIQKMDNMVKNVNYGKNISTVSFKGVKILCGIIVFYVITTVPTCILIIYFSYASIFDVFKNYAHLIMQYSIILTLSNGIFHPIINGYWQKAFRKELKNHCYLVKCQVHVNKINLQVKFPSRSPITPVSA
jgi:hypothetical protein